MFALVYRLPRNIITIFSGRNLGWHALAIGLTMFIVMSGLDWNWFLWTRSGVFVRVAWTAIVLGGLIPILGIPALLVAGAVTQNRPLLSTGWALGQAALVGFFISSTYKAFTGRIPPPSALRFRGDIAGQIPLVDNSHGFQFGLLRGGVFWGWPSGHTTVAFAMTACLIALYPRARPWSLLTLLYPLYVGLSVSVTIHWLSEFVAGAIFGTLTGIVVGDSFKQRSI